MLIRCLLTLLAPFELARLMVISRFRLRGAYWTWRSHTAFGADVPPRGVIVREVFAYARWVASMRRGL